MAEHIEITKFAEKDAEFPTSQFTRVTPYPNGGASVSSTKPHLFLEFQRYTSGGDPGHTWRRVHSLHRIVRTQDGAQATFELTSKFFAEDFERQLRQVREYGEHYRGWLKQPRWETRTGRKRAYYVIWGRVVSVEPVRDEKSVYALNYQDKSGSPFTLNLTLTAEQVRAFESFFPSTIFRRRGAATGAPSTGGSMHALRF